MCKQLIVMVTVRVQIRISKDGNEVGLTSVHDQGQFDF